MLTLRAWTARWWPVGACAAVVVALFHEAVFTRGILYERDLSYLWYPRVASMVRAVGEGAWPLWDPYPGFGVSAVADTNYQLFYPFTWLNLLMAPAAFLKVFTLTHALGAALGMMLLARRLGLAVLPAFVAGAAWTASGPWLSLVSHHHLAGAAWMPWVLLALVVFMDRRDWRAAGVLAGAAAGQLLAGSADMCHLTAWLAPVCVLVAAPRLGGLPGREWRKTLGLLAGAAGLAFCLAAPQWVPTIAQMRGSNRSAYSSDWNMYWSLHPLGLLDAIVPKLTVEAPLSDEWRTRLSESREPYLDSIYLGVTTLPLAALGLAASRGRRTWLVGVGAAFFTLAALGRHAPVYPLLLKLPIVGLFRYPAKWVLPAGLLWALLVGLGMQACAAREPDRRRGLLRLAAGLALAVAGVAGLAAWRLTGAEGWLSANFSPGLDAVQSAEALAVAARKLALAAGASVLMGGLLAACALAGERAGRWALGIVLVVLADLVASGSTVNSVAPPALLAHRPPALARLEPDTDEYRVYSAPPPEWRPEALVLHGPTGWTREASWILGRIEAISPMTCARWRLYGSFDGDPTGLGDSGLATVSQLPRAAPGPAELLRVLQTWNVRYVVGLDQERLAFLERVGQWQSTAAKPLCLWRVPAALPRIYVVDRARAATGVDAALTLLDARFDPWREIVVEAFEARRAGSPGFEGSARTVSRRSDRLEIEVTASSPGYAVVVEAYDPGWMAAVDGRRAEVLRANLVCRAVEVPAGRHRVVLSYRPRAVVWGLSLAAVGALVVLASGLALAVGRGAVARRVGDK